MPKILAHVSAAGSLDLSFDKAAQIGAEGSQIFISPPRQWNKIKHSDEEINRYKLKQVETKISPNFIHGTYLINLGTQKPEHLQKSINWLIYALNEAGLLGIEGVIFHPGSAGSQTFEDVKDQVVKALSEILKNSSSNSNLILETSAGAGAVIGDKFAELGYLIRNVKDRRLKICMDTCHVFAAGYEVRDRGGLDKTLEEFDKEIGLENLVAIHANDSKFDKGSKKDRHDNIGEGFIGKKGFSNLLSHPKLQNIPFILEVPGFEGNGPDEKNVKILKSLIF